MAKPPGRVNGTTGRLDPDLHPKRQAQQSDDRQGGCEVSDSGSAQPSAEDDSRPHLRYETEQSEGDPLAEAYLHEEVRSPQFTAGH